MKRLYECTVEMTILVMAEDEDEAREIAEDNIDDERHGADINPVLMLPSSPIPERWIHSIPYGADDDRPVHAILRDMKENPDPVTEMRELEAAGQMRIF